MQVGLKDVCNFPQFTILIISHSWAQFCCKMLVWNQNSHSSGRCGRCFIYTDSQSCL